MELIQSLKGFDLLVIKETFLTNVSDFHSLAFLCLAN